MRGTETTGSAAAVPFIYAIEHVLFQYTGHASDWSEKSAWFVITRWGFNLSLRIVLIFIMAWMDGVTYILQ